MVSRCRLVSRESMAARVLHAFCVIPCRPRTLSHPAPAGSGPGQVGATLDPSNALARVLVREKMLPLLLEHRRKLDLDR